MKNSILSGLAALALVVGVARADTVYTTDGSMLVGKIVSWSGGKLKIETSIAGALELDASQVKSMVFDEPMNIELKSGDRLVGPAKTSADNSATVIESSVGAIAVPSEKIGNIWAQGADPPEVVEAKKQAEATLAEYQPDWVTTLEAGVSRQEGNTDNLEARGRFEVNRTTKRDRLTFYLAANYQEQNSVRSANEYYGGIKYKNLVTDRLFWYTRTELEYDEFENLDLRATAAVGYGYFWIKEETAEFNTRAGLGYRHESYDNGDTNDDFFLDLGYDLDWDIREWVKFTHSVTYSPAFDRFSDYRLNVDTAFLLPLQNDDIALKLGMENDYNSNPQPGIDRLDNKYYANILMTLRNTKKK